MSVDKLQVMAAKILPFVGPARVTHEQISRGHGVENWYLPLPAEDFAHHLYQFLSSQCSLQICIIV